MKRLKISGRSSIEDSRNPTSFKSSTIMAVDEVEGNDDLLTCILVLLPPKSVFKFRSISKRWNNIIAEPFFLQSYRARERCPRLLAFIQSSYTVPDPVINMLPIPQRNGDLIKIKQVPSGCGTFISSSNGLILCEKCPVSRMYYVVNPVIRSWAVLPRPNIELFRLGLTCEENTNELASNFRVVGIAGSEGKNMKIGTYSSRTHKWTTSTLIGTGEFQAGLYGELFVFDGVFHWRVKGESLAVYDSTRDENHLQLIREPRHGEIFNLEFALTRSARDDVLWFGVKSSRRIRVWMLPKDERGGYMRETTIPEKEWMLMHTINQDFLIKEVAMRPLYDMYYDENFSLEGLIPWNPVVAVLGHEENVFLYDLEKKSIELVQYRGSLTSIRTKNLYLYMEPLDLSSYTLSAHNFYRT